MDSHAHFHHAYDDNHTSNSRRNTPEAGTKRRKVDGEKGMETKKRSVSCDVCRARKVKCVKPEGAMRCEGCVTLDQHCTYTHERKKPGPANSFARKTSSPTRDFYASLDQTRYPSSAPGPSRSEMNQSMPPPPNRWPPEPPASSSSMSYGLYNYEMNPSSIPHHMSDNIHNSNNNSNNSNNNNSNLDLSWLPISPNSLLHPQPGEADSASEGSPMGRWLHNTMQVNEWEHALFGPLPPSDPPSASGSGPASRQEHVPQHLSRKLRVEDIVAWSVIMKILHAYHAHLYPLMPIVHWPTFSQQLVAREDEKSETWRAFLLSLVTYSIIQLPRSALTFLPVKELRKLHQRCHIESRKLQNRRFADVSLVDVSTLYCDHIYLGTLGRPHAANIVLAQAIRLAQIIALHDERLGEPIYNVVERETRRRVFWLLYGSDRTITALTSNPLHIHECDLYIPLPMAIDDNLLTSAGAFPQPPHTVPILAGFHHATRLFRLLGAVLTAHRQLLAPPPDGLHLPHFQTHHRPASQFLDQLEHFLIDLPGPLQLINPMDGTPTSQAQREKVNGETAFSICRANILVSQAMVRFAIRQYARAVGEEDGVEEKAWAERDVLGLLETMSSESLAANGESLRHKVLFVASSLLEKYPSATEGHSYVTDFLAVYSRINQEQHAALLEADSTAPSRDVSPGLGLMGGGL